MNRIHPTPNITYLKCKILFIIKFIMINHYNILSSGRLCCLNVRATTTLEKFWYSFNKNMANKSLTTTPFVSELTQRLPTFKNRYTKQTIKPLTNIITVTTKHTHQSILFLSTLKMSLILQTIWQTHKHFTTYKINTIHHLLLHNSLCPFGILHQNNHHTSFQPLSWLNSFSMVVHCVSKQNKNTRPLLREPTRAPPVPDNRACAIVSLKLQSLICTFGLSVLRTPSQKMREALPSGSKLGFKLGQGHAPGPQLKMFY